MSTQNKTVTAVVEFVNSFAGLHGCTTPQDVTKHSTQKDALHDEGGGVLSAPNGQWAISLSYLNVAQAETLLMVLRDLSPLTAPTETTLTLRLSAYDEAAVKDEHLAQEISEGLLALDRLARNVASEGYRMISERARRRPILMQMTHHPFFQRLGIAHPVYALETA